jgi:predicted transcriptional regulator of viral defense system
VLKNINITHGLGDKLNKTEAIIHLDKEKTTYTRQELLDIGISDTLIRTLINDGIISRLQQGLYTTQSTENDIEHLLQLKYSKCIISHESALYHLGYSERIPEKITITVPRHFGTSRLKSKNLKIRYCSPELIFFGISEIRSIYGNTITINNLERTICDVIRHYKSIDSEIANKAIRKYCKDNPKKISILMLHAKNMGIADKVQSRLELLL